MGEIKYHSEGIGGNNKKNKKERGKPLPLELMININKCQVCGKNLKEGGYLVGGVYACESHLKEIYNES